jgi:hypothetical protein
VAGGLDVNVDQVDVCVRVAERRDAVMTRRRVRASLDNRGRAVVGVVLSLARHSVLAYARQYRIVRT